MPGRGRARTRIRGGRHRRSRDRGRGSRHSRSRGRGRAGEHSRRDSVQRSQGRGTRGRPILPTPPPMTAAAAAAAAEAAAAEAEAEAEAVIAEPRPKRAWPSGMPRSGIAPVEVVDATAPKPGQRRNSTDASHASASASTSPSSSSLSRAHTSAPPPPPPQPDRGIRLDQGGEAPTPAHANRHGRYAELLDPCLSDDYDEWVEDPALMAEEEALDAEAAALARQRASPTSVVEEDAAAGVSAVHASASPPHPLRARSAAAVPSSARAGVVSGEQSPPEDDDADTWLSLHPHPMYARDSGALGAASSARAEEAQAGDSLPPVVTEFVDADNPLLFDLDALRIIEDWDDRMQRWEASVDVAADMGVVPAELTTTTASATGSDSAALLGDPASQETNSTTLEMERLQRIIKEKEALKARRKAERVRRKQAERLRALLGAMQKSKTKTATETGDGDTPTGVQSSQGGSSRDQEGTSGGPSPLAAHQEQQQQQQQHVLPSLAQQQPRPPPPPPPPPPKTTPPPPDDPPPPRPPSPNQPQQSPSSPQGSQVEAREPSPPPSHTSLPIVAYPSSGTLTGLAAVEVELAQHEQTRTTLQQKRDQLQGRIRGLQALLASAESELNACKEQDLRAQLMISKLKVRADVLRQSESRRAGGSIVEEVDMELGDSPEVDMEVDSNAVTPFPVTVVGEVDMELSDDGEAAAGVVSIEAFLQAVRSASTRGSEAITGTKRPRVWTPSPGKEYLDDTMVRQEPEDPRPQKARATAVVVNAREKPCATTAKAATKASKKGKATTITSATTHGASTDAATKGNTKQVRALAGTRSRDNSGSSPTAATGCATATPKEARRSLSPLEQRQLLQALHHCFRGSAAMLHRVAHARLTALAEHPVALKVWGLKPGWSIPYYKRKLLAARMRVLMPLALEAVGGRCDMVLTSRGKRSRQRVPRYHVPPIPAPSEVEPNKGPQGVHDAGASVVRPKTQAQQQCDRVLSLLMSTVCAEYPRRSTYGTLLNVTLPLAGSGRGRAGMGTGTAPSYTSSLPLASVWRSLQAVGGAPTAASTPMHGKDDVPVAATDATEAGCDATLPTYRSPLRGIGAYRVSEAFSRQKHLPVSSPSWSHRLNPKQPLCRYELHGTCNHASCPWQHERAYVLNTSQLLHELAAYKLSDPDGSAESRHTVQQLVDALLTTGAKKGTPTETVADDLSQLLYPLAKHVRTPLYPVAMPAHVRTKASVAQSPQRGTRPSHGGASPEHWTIADIVEQSSSSSSSLSHSSRDSDEADEDVNASAPTTSRREGHVMDEADDGDEEAEEEDEESNEEGEDGRGRDSSGTNDVVMRRTNGMECSEDDDSFTDEVDVVGLTDGIDEQDVRGVAFTNAVGFVPLLSDSGPVSEAHSGNRYWAEGGPVVRQEREAAKALASTASASDAHCPVWRWLQLAHAHDWRHSRKQRAAAIRCLVRGLEHHPTAVQLWLPYLCLYAPELPNATALFRAALQRCPGSPALWHLYIAWQSTAAEQVRLCDEAVHDLIRTHGAPAASGAWRKRVAVSTSVVQLKLLQLHCAAQGGRSLLDKVVSSMFAWDGEAVDGNADKAAQAGEAGASGAREGDTSGGASGDGDAVGHPGTIPLGNQAAPFIHKSARPMLRHLVPVDLTHLLLAAIAVQATVAPAHLPVLPTPDADAFAWRPSLPRDNAAECTWSAPVTLLLVGWLTGKGGAEEGEQQAMHERLQVAEQRMQRVMSHKGWSRVLSMNAMAVNRFALQRCMGHVERGLGTPGQGENAEADRIKAWLKPALLRHSSTTLLWCLLGEVSVDATRLYQRALAREQATSLLVALHAAAAELTASRGEAEEAGEEEQSAKGQQAGAGVHAHVSVARLIGGTVLSMHYKRSSVKQQLGSEAASQRGTALPALAQARVRLALCQALGATVPERVEPLQGNTGANVSSPSSSPSLSSSSSSLVLPPLRRPWASGDAERAAGWVCLALFLGCTGGSWHQVRYVLQQGASRIATAPCSAWLWASALHVEAVCASSDPMRAYRATEVAEAAVRSLRPDTSPVLASWLAGAPRLGLSRPVCSWSDGEREWESVGGVEPVVCVTPLVGMCVGFVSPPSLQRTYATALARVPGAPPDAWLLAALLSWRMDARAGLRLVGRGLRRYPRHAVLAMAREVMRTSLLWTPDCGESLRATVSAGWDKLTTQWPCESGLWHVCNLVRQAMQTDVKEGTCSAVTVNSS